VGGCFQLSEIRDQKGPALLTDSIVRRRRDIIGNGLRGMVVVSQVPDAGAGTSRDLGHPAYHSGVQYFTIMGGRKYVSIQVGGSISCNIDLG
jgi:hypothetical protein